MWYYKVSDTPLISEELVGSTRYYRGGFLLELEEEISQDDVDLSNENYLNVSNHLISVFNECITEDFGVITPGLWILYDLNNNEEMWVHKLVKKHIKKMDYQLIENEFDKIHPIEIMSAQKLNLVNNQCTFEY
jgi:hypothetical protein